MVVLKKFAASTLVETLVATVLIVVIFIISSMIMNNLFGNQIKHSSQGPNNYITEIEYGYFNNMINVPFQDTYNEWLIYVSEQKTVQGNCIVLIAKQPKANKHMERILRCQDQ